MDAAGILPAFTGIACHDAWAPCDRYQDVAGHALCNAHILRELIAVTETGTGQDVIWAQQASDALLVLKDAADAARAAGRPAPARGVVKNHPQCSRAAAPAGTPPTPARRSTLQSKRR